MKIDNLADPMQEIRDLKRRIYDLETSNGLANSSISAGTLEVVDGSGNPIAGIGVSGGKSGLLIRSGGSWVTVQEDVDTKLAGTEERLAYASNRIDDVTGRVGRLEPRMAATEGVANAAKSATDNLWPRMSSVEGVASSAQSDATSALAVGWAAKNAVDNHAPRIAALEGSGGPTASEWSAFTSQFYALRTAFYNHTTHPPQMPGG
ncbi:hypothetical protein [Agrococcus sp. DT81.2]|uniref:hypothetical protein n=1 Tax=Agrococcus sp. DT81.2 TaxID=3393414 RepID=UPI003CE4EE44